MRRKLKILTTGKQYVGQVDMPQDNLRTTDLFNSTNLYWKNPAEKSFNDAILLYDATLSITGKENFQTYQASEYLSQRALSEEQLLKDHIYLAGDTWIKLFFMLDYRYPLSRSYLRRYNDPVKPRETCSQCQISSVADLYFPFLHFCVAGRI